MIKLKVRKGDEVIVISGKYKGKRGEVLEVFPKINRLVISGINIVQKHTKASKTSGGGIISKELSMHISNVAHIDSSSGLGTKVAFKKLDDGTKVRVAKKSGEIIKNCKNKDGK